MEQGIDPFRRRPEGPLVYGHRGARARATDNSWQAFQLAQQEGADGVELDVRSTRDAALVIFHDAEIEQDGRRHLVSELTRRQLDACLGRAVLSLDDVLDFRDQSGMLLNVELKGDVESPTWLGEAVARKLRDRGSERIIVSSFSPLQVAISSRALPSVPTALLLDVANAASPRLLRRVLPLIGAVAVHPHHSLVTPAFVTELRHRGFAVNVWTVNDPELMQRLAKAGVDGIITDTPRDAVRLLRAGAPISPAH